MPFNSEHYSIPTYHELHTSELVHEGSHSVVYCSPSYLMLRVSGAFDSVHGQVMEQHHVRHHTNCERGYL